ncbi:MAG: hypothetical protein AMQ74_00499 [Candidatus Methanofastidiosum methylothiophilum]|uniref:Uncharacterized protein n=1 Tax=Candidatus Methanofastidiosum methylothiophilum TaxID=1705564 RepID=A0A150J7H0_9EURY|nr:MAG: hypothetical protein AMQ74_00499 [Candidatus Methanofastidiosum methylthiophilus]
MKRNDGRDIGIEESPTKLIKLFGEINGHFKGKRKKIFGYPVFMLMEICFVDFMMIEIILDYQLKKRGRNFQIRDFSAF